MHTHRSDLTWKILDRDSVTKLGNDVFADLVGHIVQLLTQGPVVVAAEVTTLLARLGGEDVVPGSAEKVQEVCWSQKDQVPVQYL
jgi:hypothetical protein